MVKNCQCCLFLELGTNPLKSSGVENGCFQGMKRLSYIRISDTNITTVPKGKHTTWETEAVYSITARILWRTLFYIFILNCVNCKKYLKNCWMQIMHHMQNITLLLEYSNKRHSSLNWKYISYFSVYMLNNSNPPPKKLHNSGSFS